MFWHNEEFAMGLGRDISLDGVICVVDAVFGKTVCDFRLKNPDLLTCS